MKKYIYGSFFFFILTALTGVWMRAYQVSPMTWIPYDHILHAHSHLALLGWIFMGAFIIFLTLYWKVIKRRKQAFAILFSLFITSLLMFIAFLYQGYALFSILFSALHIFVEYWAAVFILKTIKKQLIPKSAKLFIIGSIIALIISSIGPYALGMISANGLKEHAIFDMAVYFYLHFQYNGWLTLFLVGLFIILLHKRNIPMNESLFKKAFWLYFIALFPSFLLSVLWADLGPAVQVLASIGSLAQWISVVLILVSLKPSWKPLKRKLSTFTWGLIVLTFGIFIIKSTLELGLMFPHLTNLVNETRSVIIGYLHLTLLGFISIFILAQYQMQGITKKNRYSFVSFSVFFTGFVLNELLLFLQALAEWTNLYHIPLYPEGLLLAALLLALGVIMMSLTVSSNYVSKMND